MSNAERTCEDEQHIAFQVLNDQSEQIALVLEPWGDVWPLAPGETCDFVFRGPTGEMPSIRVSEGYVTVFGWSGCVVKPYMNGAVIRGYDRELPPVPPTPAGMDMRRFVGMIFGADAHPDDQEHAQNDDSASDGSDENT